MRYGIADVVPQALQADVDVPAMRQIDLDLHVLRLEVDRAARERAAEVAADGVGGVAPGPVELEAGAQPRHAGRGSWARTR